MKGYHMSKVQAIDTSGIREELVAIGESWGG
jgi:hypothetical protein